MDEFKRAVQQRYPSAQWTRRLRHLHSASINTTASTSVTLHSWHGGTAGSSLWLSGDGAQSWFDSDDFTQLRQQARTAALLHPEDTAKGQFTPDAVSCGARTQRVASGVHEPAIFYF